MNDAGTEHKPRAGRLGPIKTKRLHNVVYNQGEVNRLVAKIKAERVAAYADDIAHNRPIRWLPWAGERGATRVRDIA